MEYYKLKSYCQMSINKDFMGCKDQIKYEYWLNKANSNKEDKTQIFISSRIF